MVPAEWLKHAPKPREITGEFKWNVFLSYRSVNRKWVLNLYDILTDIGFKVFLDQYILKPGDSLVQVLQDGLSTSQAGILIWSNAAVDSNWIKNEYNTMITRATNDNTFNFIPVKIERVQLPTFADTKLFVDFSDYPDGPNGSDLLRLVYGIAGESMTDEAVHFAAIQDEIAKEQTIKVNAAIELGDADRLKELFEEGALPWKTTAVLGCRAAEGLIKLKEYDTAVEMLGKIHTLFEKAIRPQQLMALALARRAGNEGKDLKAAQRIMAELKAANNLDPETLGIYARTWMDRYEQSKNINDLRKSRDLYAEAFEKAPDDYYTGINAAAKSVFIGSDEDLKKAANYAALVQKLTGEKSVQDDYWKTATIAEVLLIQKKYVAAGDMYEKAIAMASAQTGSHESTYKQAKRLMEKLQPTEEERAAIEKSFAHLG